MNKSPLLFLLLILISCTGTAETGIAQTRAADSDTIPELPLPEIPATLRQPADRAAYLMSHFWDTLDSSDTVAMRNRKFMEQNFVNFVNIYQHTDSSRWKEPTEKFLNKISTDADARRLAYNLIDIYLGSDDSPVSSEDVYINFLQSWVALPGIDSYEMIEPKYRLEAALKNRPGTPATDFKFVTRTGERSSLYAQSSTSTTLLLLYDPDCDHCMETIARLREDPTLKSLVAEGKTGVLAVCVEGDRTLWDSTKNSLPKEWTVGADESGILDNELYVISEMPGIYLIDGEKKVVLRDPSLEKLTTKLATIR